MHNIQAFLVFVIVLAVHAVLSCITSACMLLLCMLVKLLYKCLYVAGSSNTTSIDSEFDEDSSEEDSGIVCKVRL